MLIFKILHTLLAIASISIGFPIYGVIIIYLKGKQLQTALDLVLIDNILAILVVALLIFSNLIAAMFFSPVPYLWNILISLPLYLAIVYFLVSCNVTLSLKILYLFFSNILLETSDSKIRRICNYVKIGSFIVSVFVDQFIKKLQQENIVFFFLANGSRDVGPIKTGLGFILNIILLLLLIALVQIKASQINGDERYATKGVIVFSTLLIATVALFCLRTLLMEFGYYLFVCLCISYLVFLVILLQILPYFAIQSNENLKNCFTNLMPEAFINVIE